MRRLRDTWNGLRTTAKRRELRRRRPADPRDVRPDLKGAQRDYLAKTFGDIEPGPGAPDGSVGYFFRPHQLLVREEHSDEVREILRSLRKLTPEDVASAERPGEPIGRGVVAGVRLVRLNPQGPDTLTTLRAILHGADGRDVALEEQRGRKGLGPGAASLNHLVHITGDVGGCPAGEPEPVPLCTDRYPAPSKDPFAGTGVRVVVLDTQLHEPTRDQTPWMSGVTAVNRQVPANLPDGADRYAGHGTFIAGVITTIAPAAEVLVRPYFERCGAAMEAELVQQLHRILEEDHPDIISMSAGTGTFEHNGLLALNAFYETRMRHHKGVVLVAASGNDSDRAPFWPAAAPFAVSVGALNRDLNDRADFTNFGGWVDVYAPGTDIINAFPSGPYVYQEPPHCAAGRVENFTGMARWSGTSFSTPIISGLIAARMSHTGENGRDAAAALISIAQSAAQPGVGAVLMPK
jgi:subtilisin family serine protease